MRKVVVLAFLLFGIAAGGVSAHDLDLGTQLVMMSIGGLFGGAIGGGLSQMGQASRWSGRFENLEDDWFGQKEASARNLEADETFWRDEGHPPYSKPPRPELGNHMFDADKNI